jgi:deoxyribodipyrimidine photo-lyase
MSYSVVWFKRDLRINDHAPLQAALARGRVLCLYVVEPLLWQQPDAARQHYHFILESLRELYRTIRNKGGELCVVTGNMPDILAKLYAAAPFDALYSHQETGNAASYARDRAVARWCRAHAVGWHETPSFGVIRGPCDRDGWLAHWQMHTQATCIVEPEHIATVPLPWSASVASADVLGLPTHEPPLRQRGGRAAGLQVLDEFLQERSGQYRGGISSPLSAVSACSRLSPYLAYGCLSLRETVQACRAALLQHPNDNRFKQGLAAFLSRLHWHCHFIQKLESEPALETRNLHRGYDGLRESEWNPQHFAALVQGQTGWPLVDACVAMLHETGWLNFRMRAMLVSCAAYPLWLHWRPVGHWLAQQFLDYEPGIHWSQMQMQSGTTGINAARVYNPIKQAMDHDPKGIFVRRWLPAMRRVPDAWLFEPWRMPANVQEACGLRVGVDIAQPVVDLEQATRRAKQRVFSLRAQPEVRQAKAAIVHKHGSRRKPPTQRPTRQGKRKAIARPQQPGLFAMPGLLKEEQAE